jgi:oleate hydratase
MLREQGVQVTFGTRVYDLDMRVDGQARTVTGLRCRVDGHDTLLPVAEEDLVFALTGSMTEGTAYGDMDTVPVLKRPRETPGQDSDWALWHNLAAQSPIFGKPAKFHGDIDRSMWESATLTCRPSPLVDKIRELSVNDPYSGRTVTGGVITFTDSNWVLSFTVNRQPHFVDQPKDVLVVWVYALLMDQNGNHVAKPMPACTGREILAELSYHLGIVDQLDEIAANTKVRTALMPYITAQFMPRAAGDRPHVVPRGCTNLGLLGQFVETHNDVVFTMESSVRTARVAVYTLLDLPKQVPDLSPTQYDIRNLVKAARALNNNAPFPGERLLRRVLDKTYFAHILPPLPDHERSRTGAPPPHAVGDRRYCRLLACCDARTRPTCLLTRHLLLPNARMSPACCAAGASSRTSPPAISCSRCCIRSCVAWPWRAWAVPRTACCSRPSSCTKRCCACSMARSATVTACISSPWPR